MSFFLSTSDVGLASAIANDLRAAGFNVSVHNRDGEFEIYVPIRTLGVS
ncbi:hypothetical protein [Vulcanisaeta souniana]|uniref:Uncharacterized protein n=1 Tax=Vulcanisaeta souniana JCM 11219 TaxID=1293586 RepID=A0A830EH74_9CREN|nr:hypothetical protein [Vulcanisaeta souniana]GGI76304.1 hypothetical protein GCM10007112_11390 [Vulcanisaeta souniana JCM 11219]